MSDDERTSPQTPPPQRPRLPRRRLLGAAAAVALGGVAGSSRAAAEPSPTGTAAAQAGPTPTPAPARPSPQATAAAVRPLWIGSYTSSGGSGVGIATYAPDTGAVTSSGSFSGPVDPSFLTARGSDVLYAVEESQGKVTALAVADGGLHALNSSATGGAGPCHLVVHSAGGHLLTANYDSGSVAVHRLAADGSLGARTDLVQHTGSGPDPDRQDGPHAHMVLNDPLGGFVLAVDLGTDTVYTYRLDTGRGKLTDVSTAKVAAGAGPRHAAFHPSGRHLYVANELGGTLTVCGYDPDTGAVTPGASLPTVPSGSGGTAPNYPAEVVVSADGACVYVSNRGHDSVARFEVSGDGEQLRLADAVPSGGAYPRHIALDPSGAWLFAANQNSGTVAVFARDQATGALTQAGSPVRFAAAVCVLPQ